MPIGYANFGDIQQGNQQVINSMVGLGQQISHSIENHAARQSAQAMLPMLQQQYKSGMEKIAGGDPNGLGDIYGAALTASQNPLLAPMAKNAVTMAQSANINAQHMLRTQAYLQGKQSSLYGQYGSGLMNAPAGMNPNWGGKQTQTKAMTPAQQMSTMANFNKVDTDLASKQADALRLGDQTTYQQIGEQRQQLRDALNQGGINAPALPAYTSSFDTASQLSTAQKALKAEQAKGTGNWIRPNTDPKKVDALKQQIKELQGGSGQLPSANGANVGDSVIQLPTGKTIKASDFQKAIETLKQNPSSAPIFDSHFGKGAADKIIKGSQSSIDTGDGSRVAQNGPEAADEAEAVSGEQEPSSNSENTMLA
jgi:hypothetical protein